MGFHWIPRSSGPGLGQPMPRACLSCSLNLYLKLALQLGIKKYFNLVSNLLITYLFLLVLGVRCCTRAFSDCYELGVTLYCGAWASHCSGSFHCRTPAVGCGAFSSCGPRTYFPHGMWNLPRPGIETMSLALAGGFSTTGPPETSSTVDFASSLLQQGQSGHHPERLSRCPVCSDSGCGFLPPSFSAAPLACFFIRN